MGDVDFMYGLGDATASAVQYGDKERLCTALAPFYGRDDMSDAAWAAV